QILNGIRQGNAATGDSGRARSAIGLNDVAVDRDAVLAQLAQIDRRPQRTPDQPLNLHRTPALLSASRLTIRARAGCPWQHAILCRDPALTSATQETGNR